MAQAPETSPTSPKELEKALRLKDIEIASLKEKMGLLELEVAEAQKQKTQKNKQTEEVQALKEQSEGILTKAKAMIFENTKVIKNQELQIEALGQQNESLKDVVSITKDLLEIRNLEVKQLESKITAMENKVKAEKERQDLLHKKLETMIRHNGELKREYETQLCLFNALRQRYNEKELAQGVVEERRKDLESARSEQAGGIQNSPVSQQTSQTSVPQSDEVGESSQNAVAEVSQSEKTIAEDSKEVGQSTSATSEAQNNETGDNAEKAVVEESKEAEGK